MIRPVARVLLISLGIPTAVSASAVPSSDTIPGLRFADVGLATAVRLAYADQGDPSGPAVIFLHGYSYSWFSWSRSRRSCRQAIA